MDRNNFERLKTEIQMLLTEYEDMHDRAERQTDELRRYSMYKNCMDFLYKNIVHIINESEDWEAEE